MIFRTLRFSAVCMLIFIFLAGSTGVSFYFHTCGSSHKKEVFIYREIFHQKMDCCCDNNPPERNSGKETSFSDENCCRISHLFVKAPFLGFPVDQQLLTPIHLIDLPDFQLCQFLSFQDSIESFIPFNDTSPPPLSGINLVHFLHQIRIPAPVC
jgi:hypothetical protein